MTATCPVVILVGIPALCAVLLTGIRLLLRIRQSDIDNPLVYNVDFDVLNYATVEQILSESWGRRWGPYLLFISVPYSAVAAILVGAVQLVVGVEEERMVWAVAAIFAMFTQFQNARKFFSKRTYLSVRLVVAIVLLMQLTLLLGIVGLSRSIDFRPLIPTWNGTRDGIWTALLAAVLLAFYFRYTNMRRTSLPVIDEERNEALIRQEVSRVTSRFGDQLDVIADERSVPVRLLVSMLVVESLNRPLIVRKLENLIVRILHIPLTVGIAQVRSDVPLTDEQSIIRMGDIIDRIYVQISDTEPRNSPAAIWEVARRYNGSDSYAQTVSFVYERYNTEN